MPGRGRGWALGLLGVVACASTPPPAAPPPPSADTSTRPPTFAQFFEYGPFALGLRRDGVPFQGQATLLGENLEVTLPFEGGKALLNEALIESLASEPQATLTVEGQRLPLLSSGGRSALQCARSIVVLSRIDACADLLPSEGTGSEACDAPGERAWLAVLDQQRQRYESCYADTSPATLTRLRSSPRLVPLACPRLLELAGPEPSEEIAVGLWRPCSVFFPPALRGSTERAFLQRDLPAAFARAKQGDRDTMRVFHETYRTLAPAESEEIRALAIQRFAPISEAKWKALRKSIAAVPSAQTTFQLCGIAGDAVLVRAIYRGGYLGSASPRSAAMAFSIGIKPRPRPRVTEVEMLQLRQRSQLHAGKREVHLVPRCDPNEFWFFAP
jgi:hypothetical protein